MIVYFNFYAVARDALHYDPNFSVGRPTNHWCQTRLPIVLVRLPNMIIFFLLFFIVFLFFCFVFERPYIYDKTANGIVLNSLCKLVYIFCCIWNMIVLEGCSSLICLMVPRAHTIYSSIPFLDYYKFIPYFYFYFYLYSFLVVFFSNILSGLIEKNCFRKSRFNVLEQK